MNQVNIEDVETKELNCNGCTNKCTVLRFRFPNGNTFYSGNKCEKVFFNKNSAKIKGYNAFEVKNEILFTSSSNFSQKEKNSTTFNIATDNEKHATPFSFWRWAGGEARIGIPRVLNMYENFPFWKTLFEGCGFGVVVSPQSDTKLYQKGVGNVMSDNICFPAKLAQGHILSLIESKVDRIFYPIVPKEEKEFTSTNNSFNCPVVSGYPDVIRSAIDPQASHGIPFDTPIMNFANEKALKRQCWEYIKSLIPVGQLGGFSNSFSKEQKRFFNTVFEKANFVRKNWNAEFIKNQQDILKKCIESGKLCFVVAGRPYHSDPLVNQKVGQILSDLGVDVLTEDVFRGSLNQSEGDWERLNLVSQWSYPNRVVRAAIEVSKLPPNVQLVQLNSFGCGPDSFFMDETGEILRQAGKNHTVLRIDEIASPGSVRLRCRSLIESLKQKNITD
ncbi:MAG: acyl-CoA dehydratase activase-related protein [Paludibacter sp.]|nr:acyl-CoA dehydratase activase-related protein [Paludibacter sp.]